MSRILVMGAGLIGIRHIDRVAAHPRCTLAGVVDPVEGDTADVPHFRSLGEVDVPVDGVIIATPTVLHAEHGAAAAARGWHMLMEKPVTETPAGAGMLARAAAKACVACLVGHHRRYHPSVQKLKALVAEGRIGTPVTSTLIWAMKKPDAYFDTAWRQAGGSPVMINLVHDIDLMRFVLGDVTDITALGSNAQRAAPRVESGGALIRFESGAIASISFADTAPSPWGFEAATGENPNIATTGQDMWWITGTQGGVAFPSLTCWGGAADWSEAPLPKAMNAEKVVPLDAQLDHFCDVIEGTARPIIDIEDAAASLAVTRQLEDMLAPKGHTPNAPIQKEKTHEQT